MQSADAMLDRAYGALMGQAIGDALGMPTQTLTRDAIRRHYGKITGFVPPFEDHPVSHGLAAGQVTDDTEQMLLLAECLISGKGRVDAQELARGLLAWERDIRARGLRDLLGPSTKAALDALLGGMPETETGRMGTTNGAAMRIAPVGIVFPANPPARLVDGVEAASLLTHNTGEAIAAAAAVAAVVSCGLDGMAFEDAIPFALLAAEEGQSRGHGAGEADMAGRIRAALGIAAQNASAELLAAKTGTSVASCESVPAAMGIVRLAGADPWQAVLMAANIGDDTDTIGAIAGAMAGACAGISAIPASAVAMIDAANDLPLRQTAQTLLALRPGQAKAEAMEGIGG